MPDFRMVATTQFTSIFEPTFTYQKDDRAHQGVWSRPDVPLLVFSDNTLDGAALTYHGGALAGAPGGHPIQLIFWGDWWTGAGAPLRTFITDQARGLLASPYFSQLGQYGIPHAPTLRGSTIVTRPHPPSSSPSALSITRTVVELVDDLIDDDVFPDPDDGPRILFVVFLPDGFTVPGADGAHWKDYDYDFPFDEDTFWAGWVKPNPDRAVMMRVFSHEVVEMLTDPERDAWHTENNTPTNEISDAGFSGGTASSPGVAQAAFVNDVRVQSYWSNAHGATIIPIDRDYGAQLHVRIKELSRSPIASGFFNIEPSDRIACEQYSECCIEDREYAWQVDGLNERARVSLKCTRYAIPAASWSINGSLVAGSGTVTLNLDVQEFVDRKASVTNRPVTLRYSARDDRLDVFAENTGGNFEISVACSVRDRSITGNIATGVIATPSIAVGFSCAQLLLEDSYNRQKASCMVAMVRRYVQNYKPLGTLRPEEGINWDPSELLVGQPAYVLPSHYERLRWMAKVGRAANALLSPDMAKAFTAALVADAPSLSHNLLVPHIDHAVGEKRREPIETETPRQDY